MNEIKSNSNASMKFAADLKEDMSPDLSTLDMSGSLVLDQISLQNFQTIKNIEQQLGTQKLSNQVIQDLLLQFEIAQGKILVKPFQFVKDSILLQLQGASMLDGSIDYTGLLSLPASYVSREKQLVQSYVKTTKWSDYLPKMGDYLNMDMAITGTFKKPKVQLLLNKVVENYQSQLKETLMGQINQQKKQTEDKAKEELKSLTEDAQKKTEEKKEEIKQELEQKKEEAEEQVKKEAEEKSDALKKEAEKKLKDIWKPR
jgi:hypothetical protein